ncbi:AbrB/MazE/SpoVT family DNA-binding domain-containing protein [Halogeometricum sp. CBA1124]|uniref:AbrB/MazE/SpoVT family DNA-binding domain-containing protein n=1 Tax=Halogeometricum sp. CBA1124 TaxID=2668071 RepID=UPI0014296FCB|nr:AbrB/MazE/SpoVT family DNA-binding domain-containing protein [Halogeometricum sp. CBA1124]MUV57664.1 AbrB/MazE/SpoVT family DNA-binding domain-containing protein [Halogeometricum sp. CBA1124]
MAAEDSSEETKVSESGMVTIPAAIRRRLDIEPGDTIRWEVADDGSLSVDVVHERYSAFGDFEPASMGGDGLDTHDLAGHEREATEQN